MNAKTWDYIYFGGKKNLIVCNPSFHSSVDILSIFHPFIVVDEKSTNTNFSLRRREGEGILSVFVPYKLEL